MIYYILLVISIIIFFISFGVIICFIKKLSLKKMNKANKIVIICIFIFIFSILFIINSLYMLGIDNPKPNTAFSTSDLISFFGYFLSFLGSVTLGILVLIQNHAFNKANNKAQKKLKAISEKALSIEQTRLIPSITTTGYLKYLYFSKEQEYHVLDKKISNDDIEFEKILKSKDFLFKYPAFSIKCLDVVGIYECLILEILNTSDGFITVEYDKCDILDYNSCDKIDDWGNSRIVGIEKELWLNPLDKGKIAFYCNEEKMKEIIHKKCRIYFSLTNRFNDEFNCSVDISLKGSIESHKIEFYSFNYSKPIKVDKK